MITSNNWKTGLNIKYVNLSKGHSGSCSVKILEKKKVFFMQNNHIKYIDNDKDDE